MGEKGLFQADEEQCKPEQHEDRTDNDAAQVGQAAPEHRHLKENEDGDDRGNVQEGCQDSRDDGVQELDHQTTIPYPMTQIIGVRLAKAISPNPSTIGLRPRMEVANPTPKAVTRGTVMVLVVTPPES